MENHHALDGYLFGVMFIPDAITGSLGRTYGIGNLPTSATTDDPPLPSRLRRPQDTGIGRPLPDYANPAATLNHQAIRPAIQLNR